MKNASQWQREPEGAALARLAHYAHHPTMALDNCLADVQAQSEADARPALLLDPGAGQSRLAVPHIWPTRMKRVMEVMHGQAQHGE